VNVQERVGAVVVVVPGDPPSLGIEQLQHAVQQARVQPLRRRLGGEPAVPVESEFVQIDVGRVRPPDALSMDDVGIIGKHRFGVRTDVVGLQDLGILLTHDRQLIVVVPQSDGMADLVHGCQEPGSAVIVVAGVRLGVHDARKLHAVGRARDARRRHRRNRQRAARHDLEIEDGELSGIGHLDELNA